MGRLRQRHTSTRRAAELEPGEIVWARIYNGIENRAAAGKLRPVILIESRGSAWRTLGLTTRPRYRDGTARVAVPHPIHVGLRQPGWIWSDKLAWASGLDVEDHIGWVDQALVFEVARLVGLDGASLKNLVVSALSHHGETATPVADERSSA